MRYLMKAAALHACLAAAAWAQGSDTQADEPRAQETPTLLEQETLTGDWGTFRTQLADRGVAPALVYTGEVFSNRSGGLETGTRYESLLEGELSVDLEKLAGWKGGLFHAIAFWIEGDALTNEHVGDLTRVSNNDAEDGVRAFDVWLQQSLFDGSVSVRAGLLCADQEILASDYSSLFLNSSFGMPVGVSANMPISAYPVATPAARVKAEAGPFYGVVAVFDGDPGTEEFNDTGFRVRLRDVEGTLTVVEAGASTEGLSGLPGMVKAGATYHSGEFPEHDGLGTERRNYGFYAIVDQMLYRENPEDDQGFSLFARASTSPGDRSAVSAYFDAGVHYTGLFPGRDEDRIGLAVVYAGLSRDFIRAQADPSDWDREVVVELTYRAKITPWLHVQPDLQVVVHPGATSSVDDALVVGLRFEVAF